MMRKIFLLILVLISKLSYAQTTTLQLDSTTLEFKVVADSLIIPWGFSMDNEGRLWFDERKGTIKRLDLATGKVDSIFYISEVYQSWDNSGLHAMALHPQFPQQPYIFAHYAISLTNTRFIRLEYDPISEQIVDTVHILPWMQGSFTHIGSKIIFSQDKNYMFLSFGDCNYADLVQDTIYQVGQILRMNLDGSPATGNPFANNPYAWSMGHRNPQGLALNKNGIMYNTEHGTNIDDEINIIEMGRNYGWPDVQGFCDTQDEINYCNSYNIKEPIYAWTPTKAPSGLIYFDHESIPEWRNSLLVNFLKDRRINKLALNASGDSVLSEQSYIIDVFGRLRDILIAPNGKIYISTSNQEPNGQAVVQPADDRIIEISNPNYNYTTTQNIAKLKEPLKIKIYPTIVKSNFINIEFDEKLEIKLINTLGNIVFEKNISKGLNKIILPDNMANGIYFLKGKTDGNTSISQKFIKL